MTSGTACIHLTHVPDDTSSITFRLNFVHCQFNECIIHSKQHTIIYTVLVSGLVEHIPDDLRITVLSVKSLSIQMIAFYFAHADTLWLQLSILLGSGFLVVISTLESHHTILNLMLSVMSWHLSAESCFLFLVFLVFLLFSSVRINQFSFFVERERPPWKKNITLRLNIFPSRRWQTWARMDSKKIRTRTTVL